VSVPDSRFDTVVFDIGGVLVDWDPRHLYRELFDGDEERMEWFLRTVATAEWNHAMDAGRPRAQAVAELVARHPDLEALIRAWHDRWPDMLAGEIAGTVEVLDRLEERGLRLLALTNWSAETFPEAQRRFAALQRFEAVVVSGEHGVAKPDPALFRLLLDLYRVDPATAVYVDDRADNVATARALGLTGVLFTGPRQLAADLVALGLLEPTGDEARP
jgi:2-haloacid dehalogenase